MASKHTSVYQLSQWEKTDKVLMKDFNEDNAKINAALRKHDGQLLGVPALGRNLYNLFLQQKKAGQDVSWMQNLLYDDFADQSKIESMGPGMSWSSTEKCVLFTPVDGQLSAPLVTKAQRVERPCSRAFLWVRHSIGDDFAVEFHSNASEQLFPLEKLPISNFWTVNAAGEKSFETYYYMPTPQSGYYLNIRFTPTALNIPELWPMKVYDYCCMMM